MMNTLRSSRAADLNHQSRDSHALTEYEELLME